MNSGKSLRIAIISIAIIFVVHQLFSSFYKPVTTETAIYYSGTEGIDITGFVVRNEVLISEKRDGVLHFLVQDGTRVAKNGVIASVYDNDLASITVHQIDDIENQIEDIEDIIAYNNLDATDLDIITEKMNLAVRDLIFGCSTGNYSELDTQKQELLSIINRKQMVVGTTIDFSPQLEALKAQKEALEASLPRVTGRIKATQSGYFVSAIDGYEAAIELDKLKNLTPEYLDNLTQEEIGENLIGKIVSDYEWYIVAKISMNDSLNYKQGDSIKLQTPLKTAETLNATVKYINVSEVGNEAVMILACSQTSSEIASVRTIPMTIVKNQFSGLKISKRALRVSDSKTGVYVVSGMQLKFVPVSVTYSNDSYIICKQETSNSDVLRLYDEVVVKGRNLYDGKIIS